MFRRQKTLKIWTCNSSWAARTGRMNSKTKKRKNQLRTRISMFCLENRSFFAVEVVWNVFWALDCFWRSITSKKRISINFLSSLTAYGHHKWYKSTENQPNLISESLHTKQSMRRRFSRKTRWEMLWGYRELHVVQCHVWLCMVRLLQKKLLTSDISILVFYRSLENCRIK